MLELKNSKTTELPGTKGRRKFAIDGFIGAVQYKDPVLGWQDIKPRLVRLAEDDGWELTGAPYKAFIMDDGRRDFYPDKHDTSRYIKFKKHKIFEDGPMDVLYLPDKLTGEMLPSGIIVNTEYGSFNVVFTNTGMYLPVHITDKDRFKSRHGKSLEFEVDSTYDIQSLINETHGLGMPKPKVISQGNRQILAWIKTDNKVKFEWDIDNLDLPIELLDAIDVQVGTGADDGYRNTGTTGFSITGDERVGWINNSAYYNLNVFGRFTGVTIPAGSTIDTANISLWVRSGNTNIQMRIIAVDEDSPAAPTDASEFDADPLTTAYIDTTETLTTTTRWYSPEIKTVIQELLDSYTINDDAVMVYVLNVTDAGNPAMVGYYEWSSTGVMKLYIEYTEGGAYEVSASDGLAVGEPAVKGSLSMGLAASDGIAGGDSPVKVYNTYPALIDGIILAETLAAIVGVTVHELSLLDIVKTSDSPISQAIKSVLAGDGYKFNDTALAGKYYARAVSDSLKFQDGDYQAIYSSPQALTLRPNAAGDQTQCTPYGDTYNYQCVDEESADDDTTYVYHAEGVNQYWYDLYNLPACGLSGVIIDSVKIYSRCRSTYTTPYVATYYPIRIKTHGNIYTPLDDTDWSVNYKNYDYTYTTNPYTGSIWTTSEIDDLQIGVGLYSNSITGYARCTQIYIEVNYRTVTYGYYPIAVLGQAVSALDGLKLGESTSLGKIIQSLVSDGLSLSESLSLLTGYGVLASDSVKLDDSTVTNQVANLLAADGIKLSEVISAFPGVALLISVITTKYRKAEIITTLYRLIKAITTGG